MPPVPKAATPSSPVLVVTEYHEYVYASGTLLRETITTTDAEGNTTTEALDFVCDLNGSPYALNYTNGTAVTQTYYYITNVQGDVTHLVTVDGEVVAEYGYDAWGEVTAATGSMAEVNPLRYRAYYADAESGLYYLQSRYYDPVICRFVNADHSVYIGITGSAISYNLFAYCENNPAVYLDTNGKFLGTLIGAVVGAAVGAIDAAISGEDVWKGAVSGAVSGAITGAAADLIVVTGGTAAVVIGVSAGASALASVASDVTEQLWNGKSLLDGDFLIKTGVNMLWNGAFGALFGYMSGATNAMKSVIAKHGVFKAFLGITAQNTVANTVKTAAKEVLTTIGEEILTSGIVSLSGMLVEGFYRGVQTLAE